MGYNTGAFELAKLNIAKGKFEVAFDILYDLARNDLDDDALNLLTRMTFNGQLGPNQIEQFYEFLNSHSLYGNGYALFNVGLMHERGLGNLKQDYKIAIEYYEKALKEGVVDAYCNLGNIYALGLGEEQGVPRDVFKGLELLDKGAELGSREAAFTIGSLYGKGELIPADDSKSFYYLALASKLGHDQAKRVLIIFSFVHKNESFESEMAAANAKFGEIENFRKLYQSI